MTQYVTAVPAYGRDYTSQAAVKADWAAGKDFQVNDMSSRWDGSYVNKGDKPANVALTIRYAKQRKVVVIK